MTVKGDITNYGNITNAVTGNRFSVEVSGNILGAGTWTNAKTTFIGREDISDKEEVRTLEITENFKSSVVYFDADLSISNSTITFAGDVDFNSKIIKLPDSAKITFQKKALEAGNVTGKDMTFVFESDAIQPISSDLNGTIILSGKGDKEGVKEVTTNPSGSAIPWNITGSLVIEKGVTLFAESWPNYLDGEGRYYQLWQYHECRYRQSFFRGSLWKYS